MEVMVKKVSFQNEDELKKLFVGTQVLHVHENIMTLSNGTVVKVLPNSGCWGCPSGNFYLTDRIKKVDTVITNVKLVEKNKNDKKTFSLFVYTGGKKQKKLKKKTLFDVTGSEGNGFYGTGFTLEVTEV